MGEGHLDGVNGKEGGGAEALMAAKCGFARHPIRSSPLPRMHPFATIQENGPCNPNVTALRPLFCANNSQGVITDLC